MYALKGEHELQPMCRWEMALSVLQPHRIESGPEPNNLKVDS